MNKITKFFRDTAFLNKIKKYSKQAQKRQAVKNTVTIIKYDGIGDFILFLDAAKGLRELFKDKRLLLSCPLAVKEIAESSGYFDEVIVFSKPQFQPISFEEVKEKTKLLDCELLIHASVSRDFSAEALASLIKANKKVSMPYTFLFDKKAQKQVFSQYDEVLNIPLNLMTLKQNSMLVNLLGYKDFKSAIPEIKVTNYNIPLPDNYYVLFLGGSSYIKQWGVKNWYETAKYIHKKYNYKCVLLGNENELLQEEYFKNHGEVPYYSYVGKTSVSELIYVISKAKFVIGNDTCAIHISAGVKVKSLCVASSASGNRFYPYETDIESEYKPICLRKKLDCEGCSFNKQTFITAKGFEFLQINPKEKNVSI